LAGQFDQVESVEEHVPVMMAVADTLERCEPVVVKGDYAETREAAMAAFAKSWRRE
jgi:hypothetical protein